jgi:hypothetical protein
MMDRYKLAGLKRLFSEKTELPKETTDTNGVVITITDFVSRNRNKQTGDGIEYFLKRMAALEKEKQPNP